MPQIQKDSVRIKTVIFSKDRLRNYPCREWSNETVRLGDVFGGLHDDGVLVRVQEVRVVQHLHAFLRYAEHAKSDVNFLKIKHFSAWYRTLHQIGIFVVFSLKNIYIHDKLRFPQIGNNTGEPKA